MNTVARGNELEDAVFRLFRRLIDDGDFYAQKSRCRLRQRPRYYSKSREAEIVFDLSIEMWLPDATSPSDICLIECKNYTHAVPVDDVEEFANKCSQVVANKGIIVTRKGFQRAAQTYAKNQRLGLILYPNEGAHKWILYRSTAADFVLATSNDRIALSQVMAAEVDPPPVIDIVCETANGATTSVWEFFDDLLGNPTSKEWFAIQSPIRRFGGIVQYIEEKDIEDLASSIVPSEGEAFRPIDIQHVCEIERQKNGLVVHRFNAERPPDVPQNVLGRFVFRENKIELFDANAQDPARMRFTLTHELGHHFLGHSRYLALDTYDEDDLESRARPLINLTDISRLEWQANRFASCLLMPRRPLLHRFRLLLEQFDIKDRGYGVLYVDSQPCNLESFSMICSDLAQTFKVSFGAIAVRLQTLGLLNDRRLSSMSTRDNLR